jgi:hypothetical protein
LMLDLVLVLLICTLNSVPSRTRGSPCLSSNAHSRNHQKKWCWVHFGPATCRWKIGVVT